MSRTNAEGIMQLLFMISAVMFILALRYSLARTEHDLISTELVIKCLCLALSHDLVSTECLSLT